MMTKRTLFLLVFVFGKFAISAQNATDSIAIARFDSLLIYAQQGELSAQLDLARCYEFGEGVAVCNDSAESWYLCAAHAGYAPAQWSLAWFYYPDDRRKMTEWLQKASDNGWDFATTDLGICYYDGIGLRRDYARAARLFAQSAPVDPEAQFLLSMCYFKGHGVPKDRLRAIQLLQAATPYNNQANYLLAWFYLKGKYVSKDDNRARSLLLAIIHDKNALPEEAAKAEKLLKKIKSPIHHQAD